MGEYKSFEPEEMVNDILARMVVKKVFSTFGYNLIDHPDKFDVDLICEPTGKKLEVPLIEVARRKGWRGDGRFPKFHSKPHTIHYEERKLKHIEKYNKTGIYYVITGRNCSGVEICHPSVVLEYCTPKDLTESRNNKIKSGELFCDIPIDKSIFKKSGTNIFEILWELRNDHHIDNIIKFLIKEGTLPSKYTIKEPVKETHE